MFFYRHWDRSAICKPRYNNYAVNDHYRTQNTMLFSPFPKGNTTEFPLSQRGIKGDCRASEIKTATLTVNYAEIFDLISKKMRIDGKNVFAMSYKPQIAPCYSLSVYIITACSGS